jgi:hypothetical protein
MRLLAVRTTAPLVALVLLGCAAGYSASCSRPTGPPPKLGKLVPQLPREVPPPPTPPPEKPKPAPPPPFAGTVNDARDVGCSTNMV